MKFLRYTIKFLLWLLFFILLAALILFYLLKKPKFQNYLVDKAATYLTEKLGTKVEVGEVDISLLNEFKIKQVFVADKNKDTLAQIGSLNVKITDWFFAKDDIILHYIGLDNAKINVQRIDSVWNYQYIIDYFDNSKKDSTKKSKNPTIDFQQIDINNLVLNYKDNYFGLHHNISTKKLNVTFKDLDLKKKVIDIDKLNLVEFKFRDTLFTGNRKLWGIPKKPSQPNNSPYHVNKDNWKVLVSEIKLNNCDYANATDKKLVDGLFEGRHLDFDNITGVIKNLTINGDELKANLNLKTKERCGFEVKNLQSDFTFNADKLELKKLNLITNKSEIRNFVRLSWQNFNEDMANFINAVNMEADFTNTTIHSDDIAFFTTALKNWNRKIQIFNGKFSGKVNDLAAKDADIVFNNSKFKGDISIKGIPNTKNMFLDIKSENLITNKKDVAIWAPEINNLNKINFDDLGNVKFAGNYKGTISQFFIDGKLETELGTIQPNVYIDITDKNIPKYSGNLQTNSFTLGKFLKQNKIGSINNLDIFIDKGEGNSIENFKAIVKGKVGSFTYNNYTYQNIDNIDGFIKDEVFNGSFSINDKNIALKKIDGVISLNKKNSYKFKTEIRELNLKPLGITKEDVRVKGKFDIDFTGDNIDNFLGNAKVENGEIIVDKEKFGIEYLKISGNPLSNGGKHLIINTNEADIDLKGKFKILELKDAFTLYFNKYFPTFIKAPAKKVSEQDFSFSIDVRNAAKLLPIINQYTKANKINGIENSKLDGSILLSKNQLYLNAEIPFLQINDTKFEYLLLKGNGDLNSLKLNGTLADFYPTKDSSLHFPNTRFNVESANDLSKVELTTTASKGIGDAIIFADIITYEDGVDITFNKSDIIFNNQKWEIEQNGTLHLNKSNITESQLVLAHGPQKIKLKTLFNEDGSTSNLIDLETEVEKINVNDFIKYFLPTLKVNIEGYAYGKIKVTDPFGRADINWENARIDSFEVNEQVIGTLHLKDGNYDKKTKRAQYSASVLNPQYEFDIDGRYDPQNIEKSIYATVKARKFNLSFLSPFLGSVFSDIKGNASGNLVIEGNENDPQLTGIITANAQRLQVGYTKVNYKLINQQIVFTKDYIDLNGITLTDSFNNKAFVSGKIYHKLFDKFRFENIEVQSPRILALNTTKDNNSSGNLYYGFVIARTKLNADGNLEKLNLKIEGEPSLADASYVTLTSGNSRDNENITYIEFKKYGNDDIDKYSNNKNFELNANVRLIANKACRIDFILDELTEDKVKIKSGTGDLTINYKTGTDVRMYGEYKVEEGNYDYNFQDMLKKPFVLAKGGSIVWSGDPINAKIDITAINQQKSVDLNVLVGGSNELRAQVSVLAKLKGDLLRPEVVFEIETDNKSNNEVLQRLEFLKDEKNKAEMNKQVASLLVFNRFASPEQSLFNGENLVISSLSSFITSQIDNFFRGIISKLGVNNLEFNTSSNYDATSIAGERRRLNLILNQNFKYTTFNNRLIISFGAQFDYNNSGLQTTNNNSNLIITPDLSIEYFIKPDGSLRVVAYRRREDNTDLSASRNYRVGISFIFRQDF